jgi:hypothetical protein
MASFNEQQARVKTENDFTLYPYAEAWSHDQSYVPTTTYAEQSYLTIPSYEPYKAHQDYAPLQDQFHFGANQAIGQAKAHLQAAGSNYSPANSVAHSFDYHYPNHISNVSDSGASVQSTISSAMGSPSVQHQHDWNQHNYQPSIVQHDGMYTHSYENQHMDAPMPEKGCVGESTVISSSSKRPRTALSLLASVDVPEILPPVNLFRRGSSTQPPIKMPTFQSGINHSRKSMSQGGPTSTLSSFSRSPSGHFVLPLESSCPSFPWLFAFQSMFHAALARLADFLDQIHPSFNHTRQRNILGTSYKR